MADTLTPPTSGNIPGTGLHPVNVPSFYVSTINVSIIPGNDASILFGTAKPAMSNSTMAPTMTGIIQPTVLLHLSIRTLKDLSLMLTRIVADIEANEGVIYTEFSREKEG